MAYSKGNAAKYLGIDRKTFERRAKAAGFDNTEAYFKSIGGYSNHIVEAIKKQMIELDRSLDELGQIGLTEEEKQQFLDKAIQEVQPYYDRKLAETEASITEGKVRTAEDMLLEIRQVETEVADQLAYYDMTTAETEQEFIERISDITSTSEEDKALRALDWQQRVENIKMNQIKSGIFSSGVGRKQRAQEETRRQLEEAAAERRTLAEKEKLETTKKYDLEQIRLARKAAEAQRINSIGTPEEIARLKAEGAQTLGLESPEELASREEIERARTERGISPIYDKTKLDDIEESRRQAVESRKLELQDQELGVRKTSYEQSREKLLAERAKKQSELSRFGVK